ncbi:MAG: hypothetical protein MR446_01865 [Bacteroidales bacterium]|nr:hypothetical protein [Bacteroidales bacterium]
MNKNQYIQPSAHRVNFGMCGRILATSGGDKSEFAGGLGNGGSPSDSNTGDGTVLSNRPIRSGSKIWDDMY